MSTSRDMLRIHDADDPDELSDIESSPTHGARAQRPHSARLSAQEAPASPRSSAPATRTSETTSARWSTGGHRRSGAQRCLGRSDHQTTSTLLTVSASSSPCSSASACWATAASVERLRPAQDQVEFADTLQLADERGRGARAPQAAPRADRAGQRGHRPQPQQQRRPARADDRRPPGLAARRRLEQAAPRSCLAVRSARAARRGRGRRRCSAARCAAAVAGCSTCPPLLVGGEVIGSVLVEPAGRYQPRTAEQLRRVRRRRPRRCWPTCATSRSPSSAPPPTR